MTNQSLRALYALIESEIMVPYMALAAQPINPYTPLDFSQDVQTLPDWYESDEDFDYVLDAAY